MADSLMDSHFLKHFRALPRVERMLRYTASYLVAAKMCEAEGLGHDELAITGYARAAVHLIQLFDDRGLSKFSPHTLANIRTWMQRSEKLAHKSGFLHYIAPGHFMRNFWYAMREVVKGVGANEEIPTLEKVATWPGNMRGLRK